MLSPLAAFLLGLLQALTEFLPVSSSGHLVLARALFHLQTDGGVAFDVALHLGTLLSVCALFYRDLWDLVLGACKAVRHPAITYLHPSKDQRLVGALILATIPAGVLGLLFKSQLEAMFQSPKTVAILLMVTGTILLLTKLARSKDREITWLRALIIGFAQALAILPGLSRSGLTISAALFLKVDPEKAARFSFLMSIPVILGAAILEGRHLFESSIPWISFAIGFVTAVVGGFCALKLLFAVVKRGWFSNFGFYCLAAGLVGVIFL